MNVRGRARDLWKNMIGDMSSRYYELKRRDKAQLNTMEKNELDYLDERLKRSQRRS